MTRFTPLWLQNGSYTARADRRLCAALWPAHASDGLRVVADGSSMTVQVEPGACAVAYWPQNDTTLCASDSNEAVAVAPAGAPGQDRWDLIACTVRAPEVQGGGPDDDYIFEDIVGAYGAGAPVIPFLTPSVALAQVFIPGGTVALSQANIVDVRPGYLSVPRLNEFDRFPGGLTGPPIFGPGTGVDIGVARSELFSLSWAAQAGRAYRAEAHFTLRYVSGSVVGNLALAFGGAVGAPPDRPVGGYTQQLFDQEDGGNFFRYFATWPVVAQSTGGASVTLVVTGRTGACVVDPGTCWATVEDIGQA